MKKNRYLILLCLFVAVLLFLPGCSGGEDKQSQNSSQTTKQEVSGTISSKTEKKSSSVFRTIKSPEAYELLKVKSDLVFLDVRTPQERNQARIEGSKLVEIGNVMRGKLSVPKDRPLLLVCAVGGRSWVAGKTLSAMGYQEVYNLDGGIEAWYRAGFPVELGPERKSN